MVELLFKVEVLASLVVAASAAIGVSVVRRFIRDRDVLDRKLKKTDRQLQRLRKEIAAKQGRIKELQSEVEMLKPLEARLRAYHEQLVELQSEQERKEMQEGEKKEVKGEEAVDEWGFRKKRTRVDR